jgi:hypothetical protein
MIFERAVAAARRAPWTVLPVVWIAVLGVLAWSLPDGADVLAGLVVTPVLTCALGGANRWVLGSGALAFAVLCSALGDDSQRDAGPVIGAVCTMPAVIVAGMCVVGRRSRLAAELARTHEIAVAAQQVLLRPLPHRVGAWSVAGEYLSASRGARVGGDFYEVLATPFGVRVLIGDARGHGLAALGMVAALLGSFREAAHQEPDLFGVLRRLDGALHRHLRERTQGEHPAAAGAAPPDPVAEDFATVQIIQLTDDGAFQAVNCGHPQPYLLGARPRPVPLGDPLPPLGLLEVGGVDPTLVGGRIGTGEGLLLHTDGVQDARDRDGRFFPLSDTLAGAAAPSATPPAAPDVALGLRTAVQRHTGGLLADDMAVLVLVREAVRTPIPPRGTAVLSGVQQP